MTFSRCAQTRRNTVIS
uniref:Uncharacterized protein n=1 Tax=Anguilla anguilla TaxID=7936 RepID=A0A0E9RHV3_ANGAN